jgi:hypothetical protein
MTLVVITFATNLIAAVLEFVSCCWKQVLGRTAADTKIPYIQDAPYCAASFLFLQKRCRPAPAEGKAAAPVQTAPKSITFFKFPFMQSKLRLLGMTLGVILLMISSTGYAQYLQNVGPVTVTTDKPDYAPRSTAVFTGTGFLPYENVVLRVKNLFRACNTVTADSSYLPWTVQADASGGFVTNWLVCDCAGDSLRLKATGQTSGYIGYAYFSDGTVEFLTTGLPLNTNVTVSVTYDQNGGGGVVTQNVQFPSQSSGSVPAANNTSVSYSFPATIGSFTLVSTNPASPFTSGNGRTTVTAIYSGCMAPTITTCPSSASASANGSCQALVPDLTGNLVYANGCGTVSVSQSPTAGTLVGTGVHIITFTVTDENHSISTCTTTFTVTDVTAPVLTPAANQDVNLDGACSVTIPDVRGTATDNCAGTVITQLPLAGSVVAAIDGQAINVTVTATDAAGNTDVETVVLTAQDVTAPVLSSISLSQSCLWPPNHKMRDLEVSAIVNDNCQGATWKITSIKSNEPVNGTGDGNTGSDWEITGDHTLKLRAEREGTGNGRIYTIYITATDAANNSTLDSVKVYVTHNIYAPYNGNSVKVGSTVNFGGTFWDVPGNKHTAKWVIDGLTTVNGSVVEPVGVKNGTVTGSYKFTSPGIYRLRMNVTDQKGITSYATTNGDLDAIVVVYDPNGGYTVGNGSFTAPKGSLPSNPDATPKITFGFQSNYYKNATNPKGETEFGFDAGDFQFNALNFDYLVVDKFKAQFKGSGKISNENGVIQSGISFVMTVIDGQVTGGGNIDKIRMKIFNKNTGQVYFDNMSGSSDADIPVTAIDAGGNIQISSTSMTAGSATTTRQAATVPVTEAGTFNLGAYPNPFTSQFAIQIESSNRTEKVQLRVMDLSGRTVELFNNLGANQTLKLGGNYRPGMYIVEMIQGDQRKQLKLIKQPD